jgi:hypothetical protein
MKPTICLKPICPKAYCYPDERCPKCKHAFYKGQGKDKSGKLWLWEYRPQQGVDFVTKAGKHLKYQPIVGDPVWDLFEAWKKEKRL